MAIAKEQLRQIIRENDIQFTRMLPGKRSLCLQN